MRYYDILSEEEIVAYHGTGVRFDAFSPDPMHGHYFTTDRSYAEGYTGKLPASAKIGSKTKRGRNYLLTVTLTINHPLDTRSDQNAVDFFNDDFLPHVNKIHAKYGQKLYPEIKIGKGIDFIYSDMLFLYMKRFPSEYDAIIVDEGGKFGVSIVPLNTSQIKIIKRQILKDSS